MRLLFRIHEIGSSGRIDDLRSVVADEFRFEDRKKAALVVGGVEKWVRALDFLWNEAGARARTQPIATAGDRLALDRCWWREAPGEGRFEIENYRVTEVDAAGKLRTILLFDADDRVAAGEELFERYVASGAEGMPLGAIEFLRAWNEHDLVRSRRGLCDDFVLHDHRLAGMGRLAGPGAYFASVAALYQLVPDVRIDCLYHVAIANGGRVSVMRTSGVNTEGGEVESFFVLLALYREEKVSRFEMFEMKHIDEAVARLEELCS